MHMVLFSTALLGSAVASAASPGPLPAPPPAAAPVVAPPSPAPDSPVAIAAPDSAAAPAEPDATALEQMLGRLLFTRLDVEFRNTPLRDAIGHVADCLDVAIVARYATEANPSGLDGEEPMTMTLRGAAAIDVLESLLDRASSDEGNTWQFRRGFIEVGPKSRLSVPAARDTRVYPIDDLTFVPPRFDDAPPMGFMGWGSYRAHVEFYNNGSFFNDPVAHPFRGRGWRQHGVSRGYPDEPPARTDRAAEAEKLIDLITSSIEPDAWDVTGGKSATIKYHASGALVITAPDFIHRQIGGYPPPARPNAGAAPAPAADPAAADEAHRRIPAAPPASP